MSSLPLATLSISALYASASSFTCSLRTRGRLWLFCPPWSRSERPLSSSTWVISAARTYFRPSFCASDGEEPPFVIILKSSVPWTANKKTTSSGRSDSHSRSILSARRLTSKVISARTADGFSSPTEGGTTSKILGLVSREIWGILKYLRRLWDGKRHPREPPKRRLASRARSWLHTFYDIFNVLSDLVKRFAAMEDERPPQKISNCEVLQI
jgi:hypothetical protein